MNVVCKLELLISETLFQMPNVNLMFYTPSFSPIRLNEHYEKALEEVVLVLPYLKGKLLLNHIMKLILFFP